MIPLVFSYSFNNLLIKILTLKTPWKFVSWWWAVGILWASMGEAYKPIGIVYDLW